MLTSVSQRTGPPRSRMRRASKPSRRLRCTSQGKPMRALARRPQTGSNLGEASSPDSSGWTIHSSPSPSRSRCAASQSACAAIRGSSAGVADRDPPGPGQQRRLDRLGLEGAARGDVVEGQPAQRDRPVPEDRVADEAVGALGREQALQLGPRARRVEPAPDDRREAGVPVPLPGVAARGWGGYRRRPPRRAPPPASSRAARARRSRPPRSGSHGCSAHLAQGEGSEDGQQPDQRQQSGPGFRPGDAADEALPRRFEDLGHRVDPGDLRAATPATAPAARRPWW